MLTLIFNTATSIAITCCCQIVLQVIRTHTEILFTINDFKWGWFSIFSLCRAATSLRTPYGSSIPQNLMAYDEFQTDCVQNVSSDFHHPPPTTHKPFTAQFSLSQAHHSSEVSQLTEQLVLRPHNPQKIQLAFVHIPLKDVFENRPSPVIQNMFLPSFHARQFSAPSAAPLFGLCLSEFISRIG